MFIFQVYLFHHMFFIRVENLYRLIQSPVKFSNKKLLTALFFFFSQSLKKETGSLWEKDEQKSKQACG